MTFPKKCLLTLTASTLALIGCQTVSVSPDISPTTSGMPTTMFSEVTDVFPFENLNRRKWDSPIIADLDQDGLQDVMITEHGYRVRIFWNNGGVFSKPQDVANGDLHGVGVSDFDNDGRMDIILAQGGGDGANPRRPKWYQVNSDRTIEGGQSFDYFEPGRGRSVQFIDSQNDGTLNLLVTGFPMASQQPDGANHFYVNKGEGQFEYLMLLPQAKWLGYRSIMTDFNNDKRSDIIFFGGKNIMAVQGGANSSFADANRTVLGDLSNVSDVSSIAEIDFDNDGDFDLFLTRAEAQFDIETYYNNVDNRFAFLTFRKEFLFEDLVIDGDLIIENLQRTVPHKDVFIGRDKTKLEFTGDQHGHQDLIISKDEAEGWPEGQTKGGFYIGYLGDGKWRLAGESRSRLAATIRNVIVEPLTTPQIDLPAKLYENRDSVFFDVTEKLGMSTLDQTTSGAAADFNNDGWTDLVMLRYGSMAERNEHTVYLNQGGTSFEKMDNHGIIAQEVGATGGSVEAFDYDSDGGMDIIYSNERGKWHVLENNIAKTAGGNFTIVQVGRSPSGKASALGAVLTIKACGATHIRKVGSSSSAFSRSLNTDLHVGLGKCQSIDSAVVRWTNGKQEPLTINALNQTISTLKAP